MEKHWTVTEEIELYADELFAEELEKKELAAKIAAEEDEAWHEHEMAEHDFACDLYLHAAKAMTQYELKLIGNLQTRHVCRFMSVEEFDKLIHGELLVNRSKHEKSKTGSIGFCFLSDDSTIENEDGEFMVFGNKITPQDAHRYLIGCASEERFVIFELPKENMNKFSRSYGIYANPYTDGWYDRVAVSELSIETYDKTWLKPIKAYEPDGWDFTEIPLD